VESATPIIYIFITYQAKCIVTKQKKNRIIINKTKTRTTYTYGDIYSYTYICSLCIYMYVFNKQHQYDHQITFVTVSFAVVFFALKAAMRGNGN